MIGHPHEKQLALYAGGDLGRLGAWLVRRHLRNCDACRDAVDGYAALRTDVGRLSDLPDVNWNGLAAEMQANIRLGLAAGKCVERREPMAVFSAVHTLLAYAGLLLVVAASLWMQRPASMPSLADAGGVVVGASANGIELKQGGQTFGLLHDGARDVTYSAGAQGSVGARYVDSNTGYVMIHHVASVQ